MKLFLTFFSLIQSRLTSIKNTTNDDYHDTLDEFDGTVGLIPSFDSLLKHLERPGQQQCSNWCWMWDEKSETCVLNDEARCYAMVCKYDSMNLKFRGELLDINSDFQFGGNVRPTYDQQRNIWQIKCTLGSCGMTVDTQILDGVE
jgi:hypothetical protein